MTSMVIGTTVTDGVTQPRTVMALPSLLIRGLAVGLDGGAGMVVAGAPPGEGSTGHVIRSSLGASVSAV
ncbi:MAG: hypothetical protein QOH56_4301 [Pseudonocardiales bacterium]|nr:hypothetical protein [Pseudonocardiales bacterium]